MPTIRRRFVSIALASILTATWAASLLAQQGQPGMRPVGVRDLGGGQFEVTSIIWVDHGDYAVSNNHPCSVDHTKEVAVLKAGLEKALELKPEIALIASPLLQNAAAAAVNFVAGQGGDLGALLVPDRAANCAIVAVKIPADARVESYIYEVGDGGKGTGTCPGTVNGDCTVGWCRFDPAAQDGQLVTALFRNWSHDRARWAGFTVRYSVPPKPAVTPKRRLPRTG